VQGEGEDVSWNKVDSYRTLHTVGVISRSALKGGLHPLCRHFYHGCGNAPMVSPCARYGGIAAVGDRGCCAPTSSCGEPADTAQKTLLVSPGVPVASYRRVAPSARTRPL